MIFENEDGGVRFDVNKMHGCCGVAVVHDVRFLPMQNKERFYNAFHAHLRTATEPFDLDRCKVVMTDRVRESLVPSIYDFCTTAGWMEGEHTPNRKSGHSVVIFELSRQSSRSN